MLVAGEGGRWCCGEVFAVIGDGPIEVAFVGWEKESALVGAANG